MWFSQQPPKLGEAKCPHPMTVRKAVQRGVTARLGPMANRQSGWLSAGSPRLWTLRGFSLEASQCYEVGLAPAPGLQGLAVGELLQAHRMLLALALGGHWHPRAHPFLPCRCPTPCEPHLPEGYGQAQSGPAAASGRSLPGSLQPTSSGASVVLVASLWRLGGLALGEKG